MINIAVIGATGKMGTQIAGLIAAQPELYNLSVAFTHNPTSATPELKNISKLITADISLIKDIDVVIDFSNPVASMQVLQQCQKHKIPLVLGTTGFTLDERNHITQASKDTPILMSPNTSLSVNMLFKLTAFASERLANFEAEIIETHHRYKMDAPSGTAIKLGEIVAGARKLDFEKHAVFTRHGRNEARQPQDIGFAVVRGGDIVGKHDVSFFSNGEVLTLSSEINNRQSFAHGALIGALFIITQAPGLYDMFDVLGL